MTTQATQALSALAHSQEFAADVKALTLGQAVAAYAVAHTTEEVAKTRREAIREVLLDAAKTQGTDNEKGGHKLVVEGHTVLRERRVASTPDEKRLLALLEKKGLKVEDAFDRVLVIQPNPSKVNALVDSGHLTEEEAKALYREQFACVVHANSEVESLIENALPATAVEKKTRSRK
jgi:hypothetical protein